MPYPTSYLNKMKLKTPKQYNKLNERAKFIERIKLDIELVKALDRVRENLREHAI